MCHVDVLCVYFPLLELYEMAGEAKMKAKQVKTKLRSTLPCEPTSISVGRKKKEELMRYQFYSLLCSAQSSQKTGVGKYRVSDGKDLKPQ